MALYVGFTSHLPHDKILSPPPSPILSHIRLAAVPFGTVYNSDAINYAVLTTSTGQFESICVSPSPSCAGM